ncbi:MAG: hydantoinase/oxoprolinase family protein [Pseudomonadota bacterium]
MGIVLGIDTGGTYTDAALLRDEVEVIAAAKSLTTREDLSIGVSGAVEAVLDAAKLTADAVDMVSLSTTLATNALVEGKGGRICLVFIGFDAKDLTRQSLADALKGDPHILLSGGHGHSGSEQAPLDEAYLRAQLKTVEGVSGFAVAALFATRNPAHERRARDIIREETGKPVSCSFELSARLGGPKRAMTAVLNARLIGMIDQLIGSTEDYLKHIGISAPLMVVRGDGALISAAQAREKPIETILSGPAASIVGARWLTDQSDAMVSDIGGTTTDIAIIRGGQPQIDPDGARVGGLRTMVEAVAVKTFGLGGDSAVTLNRDGLQGGLQLGPRRVMPVSLLATTHGDMVHDVLDRRLSETRIEEFATQFLTRLPGQTDGLSARDIKVLSRLDDGPLPMSRAIETRLDLGSISRLSARGLVLPVGVTPSDAAHVLGALHSWDKEAAEKALTLFSRYRTGSGEILADNPTILAQRIVDQLTRQTAEFLLQAGFAEDGFENAQALATHILTQIGLDHHRGAVAVDSGLNMPLIGLGASAATYYPAIGDLLGCKTELPEYAHVANAIGAVVGQITMRVLGKCEAAGEGAFRIFLDEGPEVFNARDRALDVLRDAVGSKAQAKANSAGAGDIQLRYEEHVEEAEIDGRMTFVSASITAVASGRPRIAHG